MTKYFCDSCGILMKDKGAKITFPTVRNGWVSRDRSYICDDCLTTIQTVLCFVKGAPDSSDVCLDSDRIKRKEG